MVAFRSAKGGRIQGASFLRLGPMVGAVTPLLGKKSMAPSPSVSRWKAWLDRIRCRSPFWTRSRWHRLAGLATRLSYIYVGFMILLLLLENWFLFHPTPASEEWLLPPEGLQVEDVAMPSKLGHAVHGWWSKPSDRKPGAGAVLYFHGNAGNVSQRGLQHAPSAAGTAPGGAHGGLSWVWAQPGGADRGRLLWRRHCRV